MPKLVRKHASNNFVSRNGYEIITAFSGKEAITSIKSCPDLILLDINMPEMDGISVCKEIRDKIGCPILFLTAKDQETDKIDGFTAGGDDYITKPFSTTVLCAKVKACLRRMGLSSRQRESILSLGPFRYVCDEMRLFRDGTEIPLSSKESLLIKYFFRSIVK